MKLSLGMGECLSAYYEEILLIRSATRFSLQLFSEYSTASICRIHPPLLSQMNEG